MRNFEDATIIVKFRFSFFTQPVLASLSLNNEISFPQTHTFPLKCFSLPCLIYLSLLPTTLNLCLDTTSRPFHTCF